MSGMLLIAVARQSRASDANRALSYQTDSGNAVGNYLKLAIADDWPVMDRGVPAASRSARQALNGIYPALLTAAAGDRGSDPVASELLHQLDLMT